MNEAYVLDWFVAYCFTQAIEVPIYLRFTGSWQTSVWASTLTHPVVWFVLPLLPVGYWPMVALAETFAIVVEGVWLAHRGVRRAMLVSLLANGASATVGLLLREAFGVP